VQVLSYGVKYPAQRTWFKVQQDYGFFTWDSGAHTGPLKKGPDPAQWIVDNAHQLHEVTRRVDISHVPPQLSLPPLPIRLPRGKFLMPQGWPFSTPAVAPLIAASLKGVALEEVDVMATSMALRTLGEGKGEANNWRKVVFVQQFRHMLVLTWHLGLANDLMASGFQLERVLTGSKADDPLDG
jgi:hypothetical protein